MIFLFHCSSEILHISLMGQLNAIGCGINNSWFLKNNYVVVLCGGNVLCSFALIHALLPLLSLIAVL